MHCIATTFHVEIDEWLDNSKCEMIRKCLMAEYASDPAVCGFKKRFRKKLYKAGRISQPNFCINEHGTLFHITRVRNKEIQREVVVVGKAKEILRSMHQPKSEGVCVPGGINSLVRLFTASYYCKGIRKMVRQMLDNCAGTCKLSKVLNTAKPAIVANRTPSVMEKVQCDLITTTCKKGLFPSLKHKFRYILVVKDCFSKFCWLTPLKSKEGTPIANILCKIFHEHGPPRYLQSDNGTEFVNQFVKDACRKFNVRIVHGRPYHPQSQGQVENLNRQVKNCLRHFLLQYPEDERSEVWPSLVKEVEFFINCWIWR
jgi:hypothetical protein